MGAAEEESFLTPFGGTKPNFIIGRYIDRTAVQSVVTYGFEVWTLKIGTTPVSI